LRLPILATLLLLAACAGQPVDESSPGGEPGAASGDPAAAAGGQQNEAVEPAAATSSGEDRASPVAQPVAAGERQEAAVDPVDCVPPAQVFDHEPMLEKTQKRVYQVVYHSSRWFDGLFGSSNVECAGSVSRGYIGPGFRWDQRDGFKARFRFRADIALPAISDRANLIVGRVDTDNFVEGTDDENINSLPSRFNDFNDQDIVVGVGFFNVGGLREGWDIGVGVKLRSPLEPYVKLSYHWNPVVSNRWLWRITPQVFAQGNRGDGVSLTSVVDFAPSERWLLRSWMIGTVEDDVEGTAWTGKLTAFQSLEDNSALAYSLYANGETENEVELLDYGLELRYRRSILRPWFVVELSSSLSWPREFLIEERESNLGVGLEFNLFFGDRYHGGR